MPSKRQQKNLLVYQLKVTLSDTKPPIWRRIHVTSDTRLSQLHQILQIVMGWSDYHLHQFIIDNISYGVPDPDDFVEVKNEQKVKLSQFLSQPKERFRYEYDFGDSWEHEILVEKILQPEAGVHYPVCLTGKRACPPEDCGGVWGYYEFLEAIQNPKHPEHKTMLKWVGGSFDPDEFDVEEINEALKMI